MHTHVELIRLLHDPLSYYAPWRLSSGQMVPAQRTALNAWLCEHHALPPYSTPAAEQATLCLRLTAGWGRLPEVAYLLGCGKHRRRVLGSPLLLSLPAHVQTFLRLPFAECTLHAPAVADERSLRAWGAAYLLEGLKGRVPAWMLTRMRLCFAGLPLPPLNLPMGTDDFDMTCFWSAWNHVAHLS